MSTNCNEQINIPETENTPLVCNEFFSSGCILYPTAIPELMLPANSTLTLIIDNLMLALIDAKSRIIILEEKVETLENP